MRRTLWNVDQKRLAIARVDPDAQPIFLTTGLCGGRFFPSNAIKERPHTKTVCAPAFPGSGFPGRPLVRCRVLLY